VNKVFSPRLARDSTRWQREKRGGAQSGRGRILFSDNIPAFLRQNAFPAARKTAAPKSTFLCSRRWGKQQPVLSENPPEDQAIGIGVLAVEPHGRGADKGLGAMVRWLEDQAMNPLPFLLVCSGAWMPRAICGGWRNKIAPAGSRP